MKRGISLGVKTSFVHRRHKQHTKEPTKGGRMKQSYKETCKICSKKKTKVVFFYSIFFLNAIRSDPILKSDR